MESSLKLLFLCIAAAILTIGAFVVHSVAKRPMPSRPVKECTLEAKRCPDGSYVGRVGPQCEFAPCPR